MMRKFVVGLIAFALIFVVSGAAADEFGLTVVNETDTTITFSYPQQTGYGYLYSANGVVVSRTNNAAQTTVTFAKADSYEVATIVKGTTGTYTTPPKPQCSDGLDNDGDGKVDYPTDLGCESAADETEAPDPPPPATEPDVHLVNQKFVCSGHVDYDFVKVEITQQATRQDAMQIAAGCNGRIGRLEIDTWSADGIHIGAFAHDLEIDGGYVIVHARCGSNCDRLHADVIQVLGGQRITFRNMLVELQYAEGTNSALYINCGNNCQDRPTDVVFENSTFKRSPDRNRVVRIGNSLRSGIRNSTVNYCGTGSQCDAPSAPAIWFNGLQTDPVNENNTLITYG